MSQTKGSLNTFGRIVLFFLVLAAVITAVAMLIKMYGAFILAMLGIGLIVFFHELGHFTVAKLTDINVQAFSVGFPPVLLTIKRIEDGYLIKILPGVPKEQGDKPTALLKFTLPAKCEQGETEYRIGMIPFGGFVKMLGQDDTKVEKSSDPRSYSNKRVGIRMAVIVAGVLFNALTAAAIFIIVFFKGISLTPPVVGGVIPNSPAARAGLEYGDEFIKIKNRRTNLQFGSLMEAAGLSGKDELIPVTIKKRDGSIVNMELAAETLPGHEIKAFGIDAPLSLTIAKVSKKEAKILEETTNLQSGDTIVSVNGKDVNDFYDLVNELNELYKPSMTLLARRLSENNPNSGLIKSEIPISYSPSDADANSDAELSNIYSIVPVMKIAHLSDNVKYQGDNQLKLNDVILRIGEVNYPTYVELREVTNRYEGKPLEIEILRTDDDGIEQKYLVRVIPKNESGRTVIGMATSLDLTRPIAAKTVQNENIPNKLEIERGAKILSVNGQTAENFFDVIEIIRNTEESEIIFEWQIAGKAPEKTAIQADRFDKMVSVRGKLTEIIPFKPMERIYKAKNPLSAIAMGFYEMTGYIKQTVLTLKQLLGGQVNPKNLFGPVGIVKISYNIVKESSLTYYIYIIGLFNAAIAVFNLIPILPFDGGHVVLLAIEKITGKPVNERIQTAMVYAGLALVLALALYITFNDIVRIITRQI